MTQPHIERAQEEVEINRLCALLLRFASGSHGTTLSKNIGKVEIKEIWAPVSQLPCPPGLPTSHHEHQHTNRSPASRIGRETRKMPMICCTMLRQRKNSPGVPAPNIPCITGLLEVLPWHFHPVSSCAGQDQPAVPGSGRRLVRHCSPLQHASAAAGICSSRARLQQLSAAFPLAPHTQSSSSSSAATWHPWQLQRPTLQSCTRLAAGLPRQHQWQHPHTTLSRCLFGWLGLLNVVL